MAEEHKLFDPKSLASVKVLELKLTNVEINKEDKIGKNDKENYVVDLLFENIFYKDDYNDNVEKYFDKIYHTILDETGIYFFDGGWILYEIKNNQHTIFWFNKNILRGSCYIIDNNLYGCLTEDTDSILHFVRGFLSTLWFVRNCDIEQKIIKPKEKYRENGNKHYNESKSELIILDCRWFTELIRDIPFLVKGHFRWQPVGEGRTQKKLIWIEDFKKKF